MTAIGVPGVSARASTRTIWIWLIIMLPVLTSLLSFAYLADMQRILPEMIELMVEDYVRLDRQAYEAEAATAEFIRLLFELVFSPWMWASFVVGWGAFAASVRFALLDSRVLSARGFFPPFPWVWVFLSPIVYVIGRHVVTRRQGGNERGPLIAMIIIQSLLLAVMLYWTIALTMQMMVLVFSLTLVR